MIIILISINHEFPGAVLEGFIYEHSSVRFLIQVTHACGHFLRIKDILGQKSRIYVSILSVGDFYRKVRYVLVSYLNICQKMKAQQRTYAMEGTTVSPHPAITLQKNGPTFDGFKYTKCYQKTFNWLL